MSRRHHSLFSRGGFTLTEIMFTLAIGSFVVIGIVTSYVFSLRAFRSLSNYNTMHAEGRQSLDWFARDVRAAMAVSSCTSNRVVVLIPSAINYAGVVTATNVITHNIVTGTWHRTDSAGVIKQLATSVSYMTFSLYDQAGNVTTQAGPAVSVQVDAFLTNSVQSKSQSSDFLSARYRMRNTP
jgi:Tfp pilus assembly protein PilW